MCPETVIASCYAETREEVIYEGEEGSLPLQVNEERRHQSDDWDEDDEGYVEPVDMFVPISPRDLGVCDVCFSRIVVFVSVGFGGLCCGGGLGGEVFRLYSQMACCWL